MQPKRKQGPGQVRRPQKPVSPVFKTGDYVPLAILIVEGDKLKNYHLPQKLYAAKDFIQADVMLEYFFQHPQQPLMLDPNRPRPAEFNGAVCNFSNWMVERGYCTREDGVSDLKIHVWTPEEINADRAAKAAARQLQIEQHAEYMAARAAEGGDEGMEISQGINNLLGASNVIIDESKKLYGQFEEAALEQDRPAINVGTVGHVDHGVTQVTQALERVADEYGHAALAGVQIEVDPADPAPQQTRAFIEQELVAQRSVSDGGQAFERQENDLGDGREAFLAQERPAHRYDELLLGKPEGYADLPQPVINPEVGGQVGFAGAAMEDTMKATLLVSETLAEVREAVRTPQYPAIDGEETYVRLHDCREVSDAELLAADPKGGL